MNITILGAASFLGTNLAIKLSEYHTLKLIDQSESYFDTIRRLGLSNTDIIVCDYKDAESFNTITCNTEVLYHLVSTTVPGNSNQNIAQELIDNVVFTTSLLEACVKNSVKKVVFLSSGGTVYGKDVACPISEDSETNPISSYGVQKLTIEKLLYLYHYTHGLDYRIIRLSNPYGPFQRPDGRLGAVTYFTYKALKKEKIDVFGDGTVVRDFIFIDDAIRCILKIVEYGGIYKLFNVGSGRGTSLNELIEKIEQVLSIKMRIKFLESREVDVHENYLDISRYEKELGNLAPICLENGIRKTAEFMRAYYDI